MWKKPASFKSVFLLFFAVLCMGNWGRIDGAQAITCSFSNAPATLSFGTILSGSSGSLSGSMGFQCSASLLELTSAMCPTIEPTAADISGTTRLLRGTSGAALGYTLAFNLYLSGNTQWGMHTVTGSGTIPQQTALLPVLGSSYTQAFTGTIAAGQVVPAGTYSTTSRFMVYYTSGLVAPILLGNCYNSGQNIMSTVTITAIIQPNCNVSANNINFGTRTLLNQTLTAQGAIIVNCTLAQPYSISLASSTGMLMMNGSQSIQYGLFSDSAYQNSWSGTTSVNGVGIGSNQSIPVYARVLPQKTPGAGTYSDTVAITVTY